MVEIKEYNELDFDVIPPENYFSLNDLVQSEDVVKALKDKNKESLTHILFTLGVDVSKPVYVRNCKHRTRLTNEVVHTLRYDFTERTDEEWLKSPYASEKAKFASIKDLDLKMELMNMSRTINVIDVEKESI